MIKQVFNGNLIHYLLNSMVIFVVYLVIKNMKNHHNFGVYPTIQVYRYIIMLKSTYLVTMNSIRTLAACSVLSYVSTSARLATLSGVMVSSELGVDAPTPADELLLS